MWLPQAAQETGADWLTPTLIVAIVVGGITLVGLAIALIEISLNRKHNLRMVRPHLDWRLLTPYEPTNTITLSVENVGLAAAIIPSMEVYARGEPFHPLRIPEDWQPVFEKLELPPFKGVTAVFGEDLALAAGAEVKIFEILSHMDGRPISQAESEEYRK